METVRSVKLALPILEDFMATPFPRDVIRVWYGFRIGASGSGGRLYMEDKGTYEARMTSSMVIYGAVLPHELSHSYIGHESLTQFLELYVHNVVRTNSTDVESWNFVRNYVPFRDSNEGYAALLDIYQLIGQDAMARAYRKVYSLEPPYGQQLCAECGWLPGSSGRRRSTRRFYQLRTWLG